MTELSTGASTSAPVFQYRFVSFGTIFITAPGVRARDDERDPAALHDNEVAVNVGKANWTGQPGEPVVMDHHFFGDGQFPSSSVAVIHHAELLRERFHDAKYDVIWLVTHRPPNFDSYTAMYLARWLIEDGAAAPAFVQAGLTVDGFADDVGQPKASRVARRFSWFHPDLQRFPEQVRWAVLLASFASHADRVARIPCPRTRALHSILFAAQIRGRPYASQDSGAHEFFDEVRLRMQPADGSKAGLNPLYDSVLEDSDEFAPELSLLDGEAEAYERDLARARKTIVFLPVLDTPFAASYGTAAATPLFDEGGQIDPVHLTFGSVRRRAADGLYLRDPECILLQEWARLDLDNSSRREGFTFTMIARSGRRPGGLNETEYFVGLDPESARDCHLYPVWARLQAAEVRAWRLPENEARRTQLTPRARPGYEKRAGDEPALFSDPWYDGDRYDCRIIATPGAGSLLPPGVKRDLEDDVVANIVQDELQYLVYVSPFMFEDVAASAALEPLADSDEVPSARDTPHHSPKGRYRFGTVVLSDDVDLRSDVFTEQTARVLWRMLHPDQLDGPPSDIADECCVREGGMLGVWSTSGVMIAHKRSAQEHVAALSSVFKDLAALARGVDKLVASYPGTDDQLRQEIMEGHDLTHLMVTIRHSYGLPGGRVIERFARRSRLFETIDMLRDAGISEATQAGLSLSKSSHSLLEANHTLTTRLTGATETVAGVQLKLEWLELIFVGIYSTELANIIAEHVVPHAWQLLITLAIALILTAIAAGYLRPWEGHGGKKALPMMYAFVAVILTGMTFGALAAAGRLPHEPMVVVVETPEPGKQPHIAPDRSERRPAMKSTNVSSVHELAR